MTTPSSGWDVQNIILYNQKVKDYKRGMKIKPMREKYSALIGKQIRRYAIPVSRVARYTALAELALRELPLKGMPIRRSKNGEGIFHDEAEIQKRIISFRIAKKIKPKTILESHPGIGVGSALYMRAAPRADLKRLSDSVIVPKFKKWRAKFDRVLTDRHIIGYSVPTRYGATTLDLMCISHPVHLLDGRPDRQRLIAARANVVSIDCNRFTLDASFGDYFDGVKYNYQRELSYDRCLMRSMAGIDFAWSNYRPSNEAKKFNSEWRRFRVQRTISGKIADAAANLKSLLQTQFGLSVCPSGSDAS